MEMGYNDIQFMIKTRDEGYLFESMHNIHGSVYFGDDLTNFYTKKEEK